jgi:hypothetical protein
MAHHRTIHRYPGAQLLSYHRLPSIELLVRTIVVTVIPAPNNNRGEPVH